MYQLIRKHIPVAAILTIFLGLGAHFSSTVFAQTANTLVYLEDVSAASQALGGAVTAKADDLSMITINPAALNSIFYFDSYLYHKFGFFENSMSFLAIGFLLFEQKFAIASSIYYPNDVMEKNDFGIDLGAASVFDTATSFLWAYRRVINNESIFDGTYEFGVSLKMLYSKLLEFSSFTGAVDFGMVYRNKFNSLIFLPHHGAHNLSIGLSILNQGPDVKYGNVSHPQPMSSHLGIAYNFWNRTNHNMTFLLDSSLDQDATFAIGSGLEYVIFEMLGMRMGYRHNDPLKTFTLGMFVRYNYARVWDFKLQYSMGLTRDELRNEHYVGLSLEYNHQILQSEVNRIKDQNEIWNKKIDNEMLEVLRTCIREFKEINEKFPDYLDEIIKCTKEFGFNTIPEALTGKLVYTAANGEVKITEKTADTKPDTLYMRDGSMIKGKIDKVTTDLIHITNVAGTIMVMRELIDYTIMGEIDPGDLALLREIRMLISNIKENTGSFPKNLEEIREFFKIRKNIDMPDLRLGKFRYNDSEGKIYIVDSFNVSF